jgi:transglutaminase-like putative cysteine protease
VVLTIKKYWSDCKGELLCGLLSGQGMRKVAPILFLMLIVAACPLAAQDNGFAFGQVKLSELDMTSYPKDTSAAAVVLQEFGEAYLNQDNMRLEYVYHVKLKILRQPGLKYGNVEVYLHRQSSNEEAITTFKASSFNYENNRIVETKMEGGSRFRQELGEYTVVQNYAIPNVKVGSVIEYTYTKVSPWLQNFHPWEFQDDIPKVLSEYWALIPAYYQYSITLIGYLKLASNEAITEKECFNMGRGPVDCSRMKYMMKDIPAFVSEKYMSARSNHISRLNFELQTVYHPDGRVDNVTKEWKDAAEELKREARFGGQIRKGTNFLGDEIAPVVGNATDPLEKARKVYDFIKGHFKWNGVNGKYSANGVKKAFDAGEGNVGDINLALIAAMRAADLPADPVILSTRANGFPAQLHPVLTDFNYVIARLDIGGKVYLLDATDDFIPFGLLPEHCLNGSGRWLRDTDSDWVPLDAPVSKRSVTMIAMKVLPDGKLTGSLSTTYMGYAAVEERRKLLSAANETEYINDMTRKYNMLAISNAVQENAQDVNKPLVVKYQFELDVFDPATSSQWLFNPFFASSWKENPLKSEQRFYPVEFGVPLDERMIITIDLPEGHVVQSMPENAAIALPNGGGKYLFQTKVDGTRVSMNSNFSVSRDRYAADEYLLLKEFFARMIQTQAADMVIAWR